jgi:MFS family permease
VRRRFRAGTLHTFRSLRTRNFRLFFFGQLVSQAGTWMQTLTVIWLVLELTDSGVSLGVVTAAQFFPVLLLGAWGGVVADRVDRLRFTILTQSAFALVAVAFTVLTFTDLITVGLIYVLSAAFGVITALDNPARRALVAELVAQEDVANAVGLNSAIMTGSRVVGPAVAGVVLTTAGPSWCFAVNAVTYAAVLAALFLIDRAELRSPPPVPRGKGQLREGLRYAWRTTELRLPLLLLAVVGTLAFEFQVTLPLLAERTFGGGPGTFTLLYSSMSAGSVAGALLIARRTDADTAYLAKAALWLGGLMVALALAPTLWLAVAVIVPVGGATILLVGGTNTLIQLRADPSMRGRVLALTAVVFLGSTPIGGPVAGYVSEHFGARYGVLLGAVSSLLVSVWVLRELRHAREQAAAAEPVETPAPTMPAWTPLRPVR